MKHKLRDFIRNNDRNNSTIIIIIHYKPLDRNSPPRSRYKPEPVLETDNMILFWERCIITVKTVNSTDLIQYSSIQYNSNLFQCHHMFT
jgi:hypothetical protein